MNIGFFILFSLLLPGLSLAADFERMEITGLSASYVKPKGEAEIEKVKIDFSNLEDKNYVLGIERKEDSFLLDSPFFQLRWMNPFAFIHNMNELTVTDAHATFGKNEHSLSADEMAFSPDKMGAFSLNNILGKCSGNSTDIWIENRLIDDCLNSAELTISSLDVPVNFFINEILAQYPQEPMPATAKPADSFKLSMKDGDFSFMVYTRVVFYAGLRAWGNISLQNNRKTVIIRVDQIKFGYIPITGVVMKELSKRNRNPDVIINDNYIIVNLK